MVKDDIVTITIEDIGIGGEGIGKINGYTLFVKDAVIGDVVEVKIMKMKKNYGYARLMNIITPSQFRVIPKCKIARQCGGCQIQALAYEKQLEFKEAKVRGNLKRIAGFDDALLDSAIEPICGMEEPFYYRNKAQFPIGTDKEGTIITGFYAGHSHQIIPNTDCILGAPVNKEVLTRVLDYMNNYKITSYDEEKAAGLVRHVLIRYGFVTKEVMVCLIVNGEELPHSNNLIDSLCEIKGMTSITINVNKKHTNVIMGEKLHTLWGQDYITDYIGDVKYQISPLSFYQVNPVQTEKLYSLAVDYAGLTRKEIVWDLYCGIGTISLFLAQKAKQVYGVEVVPRAVADANKNAEINGIGNVKFFVGKAEEVLPKEYVEHHVFADVIIVDPPRKGCEENLLQTMAQMR
ncbi:MAG: 23S rRNA (uracil(1939)-C(5))-methyltransferase RlmD, partial [Lachnospiraceae bacterium]|nr:23S rRNA (uracil(1939)-C(5))-methyltransferase RlmD [Lachnospiraceae bacterium]